jgi:cation transport ATPase
MRALWVLRDGDTLGVVAFHEQGPSEAQEVIAALKARNRRARFVYISKHPQALAEAIAGDVGVFTVFGDLDSAGKVDIFRTLGRRTVWIGDGADPEALASIEACAVSVSIAGLSSVPEDAADVVFLQPGLRNLAPFMRLGREHRARLAADYRAVYAANLLGAAGGFVAGFGSLQAGLTSNAGTAYVYAKHWVQLQNLISRVEARRAQILSPTQDGESYEELDYEEIELSLEAAEAKIDQIEQLDDQDFETPAQTGGELDGV